MYQMYMPIAKELYEKINQKRENGNFNNSQDVFDYEEYEYYSYYAFSRFETSQTVGFENKANIGFALIECLKSIDMPLATSLEQKLNKEYSRCKVTGKTEDICQRYFHYGKDHVQNTIEIIDKYHESLKDISESKLNESILSLLPTVKQLLEVDKHTQEETAQYIAKLENASFDLTSFCDGIEIRIKKSFVKNLNSDVQKSIEKMKSNPSKLKRMNGQDFNLIIHSSLTPEEFIQSKGLEYHTMISTSLIDDKNIRCYQSGNVKFAFYQQIEQENLISAFSGDGITSFSDEGILTSFAVPDYVPTKEFKSKTRTGQGISAYSEIMIKSMRPDAIVCYDYVTEQEMELADKYELDLILIETKYYKDMLKPEKVIDERFIKKADLSKYENNNTIQGNI